MKAFKTEIKTVDDVLDMIGKTFGRKMEYSAKRENVRDAKGRYGPVQITIEAAGNSLKHPVQRQYVKKALTNRLTSQSLNVEVIMPRKKSEKIIYVVKVSKVKQPEALTA